MTDDPKYEREIDGYALRLTCPAMPEQYEVYFRQKQVAYFRLRHGFFTVSIPWAGGTEILRVAAESDGQFRDELEREYVLRRGIEAVKKSMGVTADKIQISVDVGLFCASCGKGLAAILESKDRLVIYPCKECRGT